MSPLGQAPESALAPTAPAAPMMAAPLPPTKEIPYDYVARFQLRGQRGNRVQDLINVSVEGAFVAAAIGYSFLPARRVQVFDVDRQFDTGPDLRNWAAKRTVPALINQMAADILTKPVPEALALVQFLADPIDILRCLQAWLCGIDFKYSIVDSATGRELQNQPIHSIAGLGEAAGNRPFRPFAKPILFMPRSTIRIEVEEISEGPPLYGYNDPTTNQRIGAELFIVLHGYKILGYGIGRT